MRSWIGSAVTAGLIAISAAACGREITGSTFEPRTSDRKRVIENTVKEPLDEGVDAPAKVPKPSRE